MVVCEEINLLSQDEGTRVACLPGLLLLRLPTVPSGERKLIWPPRIVFILYTTNLCLRTPGQALAGQAHDCWIMFPVLDILDSRLLLTLRETRSCASKASRCNAVVNCAGMNDTILSSGHLVLHHKHHQLQACVMYVHHK